MEVEDRGGAGEDVLASLLVLVCNAELVVPEDDCAKVVVDVSNNVVMALLLLLLEENCVLVLKIDVLVAVDVGASDVEEAVLVSACVLEAVDVLVVEVLVEVKRVVVVNAIVVELDVDVDVEVKTELRSRNEGKWRGSLYQRAEKIAGD